MPRRSPAAIPTLALVGCILCAARAFAQGTIAAPEGPAASVPAPSNPAAASPAAASPSPAGGEELPALQKDSLLVELSTAGYYELAARARELGLSDSGAVEELRARLYDHFGLKAPPPPEKGRIITIERAGEAEYAKVEEEPGGLVRASGGVVLSLVETNGDSHSIRADSIVFNRARSTLTARGAVHYERSSGGTTQIFTGEALSVDLNDWSGVFLDGKFRQLGGQSPTVGDSLLAAATGTKPAVSSPERGLLISAETMIKRSPEVMVLENGVISSCDADDPHYSVRAKRVWILGSKEWALSNAVISLGNVPIMWLPFFYYPGDEILFHPVIGYRSREGRFFQTTVYLIGAKPPKLQGTSFLELRKEGPAGPTKVKGLFLQRVPGPAPPNKGTLKTMADAYSGLGYFAGVSGSFPKLEPLGKTDLFAAAALSRSLFPVGSATYSPYVPENGYSSSWNYSNFLGLSLPLRYGLNFSTSYAAGGLNLSLALPLFSDPYLEQDFMNRSEDMDWFKALGSSPDAAIDPSVAIPIRSQLNPKIEATYSLKPQALGPWLSSVDVTRMTTYATLLSKTATAASLGEDPTLFNYDPRRSFFYPSVFRPFDAAFSLRGSLIGGAPAPARAEKAGAAGMDAGKLELRGPWSEAEADKAGPAAEAAAASEDFRLPARAPGLPPAKASYWGGGLGWTMTPSAYYEDRYLSDAWSGVSDINYARLYSLLSFKIAATLDGTLSYGDYLSSSLSLSYADQSQQRPYLYDDGTPAGTAAAATYTLADKLYTSRVLSQNARLTYKPFASSWLWSGSSLSWGMVSTIYGLKYDSASSAFQESWMSWNPSMITSHDLTATLAARPGNLTQSLTITATLPPLLESYKGTLALNAGIASLNTQSRMYRAYKNAGFSYDPLTTAVTIGAAPMPVLTDTFVYGIETSRPESNVAGLSWGPFSSSLTATRTSSYTPKAGVGWVATNDTAFRVSALALGLAPQFKSDDSAATRSSWSFKPRLSLSQSLVRFTESSLGLDLDMRFAASDTLSFELSSRSLNTAAWRYFPGLFRGELAEIGKTPADFQVNPLVDIWNSLSVWNGDSLRRSLFKLKSLSLKAAQDLHDWTLSAEISTTPLYNAGLQSYALDTSISILLAWKDVSDIKTTVKRTTASGITY